MNCPECNQPVGGLATKCHHCGAPIDEKTFFLSEADVMEEIQAARTAKAAEDAKLSHRIKIGQILTLVGGLACVATIFVPTAAKLATIILGVVIAGGGVGLWWASAKA